MTPETTMATLTGYTRNNELNLWSRPGVGGIAYTDGEISEQRVYATVSAAMDRSTFSPELSRSIVDWPSEYHLSRERHCLVRPLGIKSGDKVLELGCGCGAITRFLGELGSEVTAVEGSLQRGRIAAERCRDLPNVSIVVDNLLDFETTERFQWILLVGVLEYASVFSDEEDPAGHYLRRAARFLADDGKLVVAIENKLGLKYFNGLAEDHLGTPFVGIQGLYGEKSPHTFGRNELALQIKSAGVDHLEFFYPFPDYKLPRVIFSEQALSDELFNPADLLARCAPRDYGRDSPRSFDDSLVASEVAENGLLADLSNSFLVVASRRPLPSDKTDLAFTFAAYRAREFATQTRFVRSSEGIRVIKEPLDADVIRQVRLKDGSILENLLAPAAYISGGLLYWRLLVARAKQGGLPEIAAALNPWFEVLLSKVVNLDHVGGSKDGCLSVPGRYLDLTPFNLIEGDRDLVVIDDEWSVDRDIPLSWIVTRTVLDALCATTGFESPRVKLNDIVQVLYSDHGLTISESEIVDGLDREAEFQALVMSTPQRKISSDMTSKYRVPLHQAAAELQSQIDALYEILAEQGSEVSALKSKVDEQRWQLNSLKNSVTERDHQIALLNKVIESRTWENVLARWTRKLQDRGARLRGRRP